MSEDVGEVFAVVAEMKGEGPLLHETVGRSTSLQAATARMRQLLVDPRVVRACVVRLVYEDGNELLIHDLKRMQE